MADGLGPDLERFFELDLSEEGLRALRRASATGRPLGGAVWIKALETSTERSLAEPPPGRSRRREANPSSADADQAGML